MNEKNEILSNERTIILHSDILKEWLKKLSFVEENLFRCTSNAYDSDFQLGCLVGISQQEITQLKEKVESWIGEE